MTGELSFGQMTHSQEEFSIHLSQAINYLHSHHRHIKTWAALFIGGQQGPGLESSFYPGHPYRGGKEGLALSRGHTAAKSLPPSYSGYTTCNQPQAVSQIISDKDIKLLFTSKWPTPQICLHTSQLPAACPSQTVAQTPPHQGTPCWSMDGKSPLLASYPDRTGAGSGGLLPSQGHL